MTNINPVLERVDYPESDGEPMTESGPTRDYLIYCVEALSIYFRSRRRVYVSGNLFVYYVQGDPKFVVSPDVFVVFGVSKRKRRTYKVWEEGNKVPNFVLEVTSATTRNKDEIDKPRLYASLGVQEYFQYDPTGDYLMPQLKGSRLVNGQYQPIALTTQQDGSEVIPSQVLGLHLHLLPPDPELMGLFGSTSPRELRFYDPQTGEKLLSHQESEAARQKAEEERQAEAEARQRAEEERQQVEEERQAEAESRRAAIPRLQTLGLTPEQIATVLGLPLDEVNRFIQP